MKRVSIAAACGALLAMSGIAAGQITIYQKPNFGGPEVTMRDTTRDLKGTPVYDQGSSAVVTAGRWEVCSQPDFKGDCMVLGPGRYERLDDKLFHRTESVRRVDQVAAADPQRAPRDRDRDRDGFRDRGGFRDQRYAAIEVFVEPGFRGPAFKFDNDREILDSRFNDEGVASLIVREGRWQLCSEGRYGGYCRTFEPGRYPRVGRFAGEPIGSLRRIS